MRTSPTSGQPQSSSSAGQIESPYQPISDVVAMNMNAQEYNLHSLLRQLYRESPYLLDEQKRKIINVDVGKMNPTEVDLYVKSMIKNIKHSQQEKCESTSIEPNEDGSYNHGQKVNIGSLLCYLTGFHIGNCDLKEVFRIKEFYTNNKLTSEQVKKQIYGDLYTLKIDVENFDDDNLWDQIKKTYGEKIKIRNIE